MELCDCVVGRERYAELCDCVVGRERSVELCGGKRKVGGIV